MTTEPKGLRRRYRGEGMNKLIDNAVNRFLAWKLPKDFGPDCGISFDGRGKDARGYEKTWPVGTNLFTAEQARAMFEYCLTPAAETTKDNAGIAQSVAPTAVDQSGDPVAWMFDRRYGSGLSFKRPADYEDAEGNIVRPTPLYTIGGQGHVAAARCSDRSIASSEATCLNAGPSARIGTDIQHGKLDADAGSIPAPPTTSPDPYAEQLVERLLATRWDKDNCPRMNSERNCSVGLALEAAACIVALQERCAELERVNAAMLTHMESFRIVVKERDETIGRLQKSHTEAWNLSVKDQGRAERAEAEVARLTQERDELEDYLLRHGFVRCDISACNCGSWHHRYGLPERWQELKDDIAESGHPLCNSNGNNLRKALGELIAERDKLRRVVKGYRTALRQVYFLEHNEREWQSLEEAQEHAKAECKRIDAALKELDAL